MSQLTQEIQEVFDSIVPKKPIYSIKISSGWGGDVIKFNNKTSSTLTSNSFLKDDVVGETRYRVDYNTGVVSKTLDNSANRRIRDDMLQVLINFICRYSGSSNPKLTTLYKWYKAVGGRYEHILNNLPEVEAVKFEDLLFNVWKFTQTSCNTGKQRENAIKILEFINAKYKTQLKGLL